VASLTGVDPFKRAMYRAVWVAQVPHLQKQMLFVLPPTAVGQVAAVAGWPRRRRWRRCSWCQKMRCAPKQQFCWGCLAAAAERLLGVRVQPPAAP